MEILKLTKEQRNTCYIIILSELMERRKWTNGGTCTCLVMKEILGINDVENFDWHKNSIYFPEFLKRKPADKVVGEIWWDVDKAGMRQRIKVLKECIEETS